MSKQNNLTDFLTDVADAIRTKKGYPSTQKIDPQDFSSEIEDIQTTPTLQEKFVSFSPIGQVVTPDVGYDGLSKVMINGISPTKAAETFTPKTYDQVIASGRWLTGNQTIKGDTNLLAKNIKKGVSIFGVTGTFSPTFYTEVRVSGTLEKGDYYTISPADIPSNEIWVVSTNGYIPALYNGAGTAPFAASPMFILFPRLDNKLDIWYTYITDWEDMNAQFDIATVDSVKITHGSSSQNLTYTVRAVFLS